MLGGEVALAGGSVPGRWEDVPEGEAGLNGAAEGLEEDVDVGQQENIKVVVRVRPLMHHEAEEGRQATSVIDLLDEKTLKVRGQEARHKLQCRFDAVFGGVHGQEEVYQHVKECTTAVVEGFNATVFAYGQTGSGKTHTMFGPPGHVQSLSYGATTGSDSGIIPRAIVDIFEQLGRLESSRVSVYCSFVQIYNEQLFDMLRDPSRGHPLEVHEDPKDGIFVQGLSEYSVRGFHDCMELLRLGEENRAIRETHMNQASSRSHSIFQLLVEQKRVDGSNQRELRSKFNLVDLAGSEKWDLNQSMEADRVAEMTNINLSLYTLGRCIAALAAAARRGLSAADHVPFRESKLTRLLQDSLGGNAKTRVIATLSPASDCVEESVSTLKFADRAKQVMVFLRKNVNRPVDFALVQRLQREVAHLRNLLREISESGGIQHCQPQVATAVAVAAQASGGHQGGIQASRPVVSPVSSPSRRAAETGGQSPRRTLPAVHRQQPSDQEELHRLRQENERLQRRVALLSEDQSTLPSLPKRPSPGELDALRASNHALTGALKTVSKIAERFFSFEIEEDDMKAELEECLRMASATAVIPSKAMSPSAGVMRRANAENLSMAGNTSRPKALSPHTPPRHSIIPSASGHTRLAGAAPGASGRANQGVRAAAASAASAMVAAELASPLLAPPIGVDYLEASGSNPGSAASSRPRGAFRVRGKGSRQHSKDWVDEEEEQEKKLQKELADAKARMRKHMKLQEWLKKKEEKELAALEATEKAQLQAEKANRVREKKRRTHAKKAKKKLAAYYDKVLAEAEGETAPGGGDASNGGGGGSQLGSPRSSLGSPAHRGAAQRRSDAGEYDENEEDYAALAREYLGGSEAFLSESRSSPVRASFA